MGRVLLLATLLGVATGAHAATLGTVIPVRGHLSDIVVDTKRNVLYAANFTASRIEVLSLDSQTLVSSITVNSLPTTVAVSPDNHFLVVGHYNGSLPSPGAGVTVVNLDTGAQQSISVGTDSVLGAAFGNSASALLVTTSGVLLLDPVAGTLRVLSLTNFATLPVPVPWATYPGKIISASAGVSGDGNSIFALVDQSNLSTVVRYRVSDGSLNLLNQTSSPALGPRVVSVDQSGGTVLAGWVLYGAGNSGFWNLAQFPSAPGVLEQGGHVMDTARNLIYAQVTPATTGSGTPILLQVFDSDNLTVRETFRLQENLAGKALMAGNNMYGISDSGITVLPMGALSGVHRLQASAEDLLFQSNGCNLGALSQELDILDPGGNVTDFKLTSSSPGITFSMSAGTTPASIKVFVDPTAFQDQKGTSSVTVTITSSSGVNLAAPVRVLINTRNPDQQGIVQDVPGTIVDVLADPVRDRFYVLRQDKNQVLVFDGTGMNQLAVLRTGNTPVQMAIYQDNLLVTNDNSQLINVFALSTLTPSAPILFPSGYYPRSIAVAGSSILTTTRSSSGPPKIASVDFFTGLVSVSNGVTAIFTNDIDAESALTGSPSGRTIFMVMPSGVVAIYDTASRRFVASRSDLGAVSGAYAAFSDDQYLVGNHVLNTALVPSGQVNLLGGVSSGVTVVDNNGLLSSAPATARNGVMQRFSLDQLVSTSPVRTAEAPDLAATIARIPVGQTGQTILPFTRTLAPLSNGQSIVQLSTSGFTSIPWTFEAPTQTPAITAVTNAADQTTAVAAGGLITLWGTGMSSGSVAAPSLPLANALNNVCLYADSVSVPLLFVSPNQINAQLPFGTTNGAHLVLSNESGTSAPFTLASLPAAPAIFRSGNGTPLIVRTVDGQLITDATPIHLNQTLIIYLTGLGPVTNGVAAGNAAPLSPLAETTAAPAVYIGGSRLFTLWSGLAPGFVGVYQVNALVPFHNVPTGSNIPFTVIQGNAQTTVKLRVEQ